MHEFFQVDAGNLEVRADIGNLGRIRLEHKWLAAALPSFFRYDGSPMNPGAGYDEGVGNRCSLQPLLRADQALEVLDLEYFSDKLELRRRRRGEEGLVELRPIQNFLADRLPFEFLQYFPRGNQLALFHELVQPVPDALEHARVEMLKGPEGTGVEDMDHASAPCKTRSSNPA